MARKKHPFECGPRLRQSCGSPLTPAKDSTGDEFRRKVFRILGDQGAIVAKEEQRRFAECLEESIRRRRVVVQRWSKKKPPDDDIIRLIQIAADDGDTDEAIWRGFLAAHFGRASADHENPKQLQSASRLLCAFGDKPHWTWERVRRQPSALKQWLLDHRNDLQSLSFGNHRKYESKKPRPLWKVIKSFLDLAEEFGDPAELFAANSEDPEHRFDVLYERLRPLFHFGRTGRFDYLELLVNLELLAAEPHSCYLKGATGPKRGAVLLWGHRPINELERLAAELAGKLGLSAALIEDCLCNWQKKV